jgi:hypothetical protein
MRLIIRSQVTTWGGRVYFVRCEACHWDAPGRRVGSWERTFKLAGWHALMRHGVRL